MKCARCKATAALRHTGARFVCAPCWAALFVEPWPTDGVAPAKIVPANSGGEGPEVRSAVMVCLHTERTRKKAPAARRTLGSLAPRNWRFPMRFQRTAVPGVRVKQVAA